MHGRRIHDNNSIFPMLATLSGAMLASGVGWYPGKAATTFLS